MQLLLSQELATLSSLQMLPCPLVRCSPVILFLSLSPVHLIQFCIEIHWLIFIGIRTNANRKKEYESIENKIGKKAKRIQEVAKRIRWQVSGHWLLTGLYQWHKLDDDNLTRYNFCLCFDLHKIVARPSSDCYFLEISKASVVLKHLVEHVEA